MRAMRAMMVAATVSLAACGDVFGPGTSGTYYLRSANGQNLPAVVFSRVGADGYTVQIVGGELRLRRDDSFRLELDFVERDARSDSYYTQGISGYWTDDGDIVELSYIDPETGTWRSLGGFQRRYQMELTVPTAVYGVSVRAVMER